MWAKRKPSSPTSVSQIRAKQALADERLQVRGHRVQSLGRRQLGDRPPPEDLSDHGRALQHVALVVGEPVEPGGENGLDRLGHRERVELRGEHAVALDQPVVLGQHSHHLAQEERVAAGGAAELPRGRTLERADEMLEQRRGVVGRQRLERQHRPGRAHLGELAAGEAADEDRRIAAPAGEVLDEVEEGRLRPLDVVQDEHDGPVPGEGLEEPPHGPVELVAPRAGLGAADGFDDAPADGVRVRLGAERLVEVDAAHDLDERPVRDPAAVREAGALEHERLVTERAHELGREPRLADARLADDRDRAARPLRLGPAQLEPEPGELRGAADERRVHPPHQARDARLDLEQPPRHDGLGLALHLDRLDRLRLHGVAHEPERHLADQDLTAAGRCLEALRDDDGVARGEGLPL